MLRRPFLIALLGIGCWLLGMSAPAQAQSVVDEALLAEFDALIQSEMTYFNIPGAAVAVIAGGKTVYAEGFGVRDLAADAPFTTETRFRIGSTTKSMTALLVAQLVDEGLVSWDTPVSDLFPAFSTSEPELAERITVRDLMSMGTGLVSSTVDGFYWGEWDVEAMLGGIAAQPVGGAYGEHYSYNNEVYALAGYAAATAAGLDADVQSYADLMQTRIFDPVGMTSAIITDDESRLGENYSLSYEPLLLDDGFLQMADPPIGVVAPSGAVWAHVEDMARYVIMQMNGGVTADGRRIVSEAALAETWQPGVAMPADAPGITDSAYGMGWVTQTYQETPIRFHDGGWAGYNTQMAVYPAADVGLVVFANSTMGGLFGHMLVYAFAEMVHDLEPGAVDLTRSMVDDINAQIALARPQISAEIGDASALIGAYEQGWRVEQRSDASVWLVRGAWEFRLGYLASIDQYVIISGGALGVLVSLETGEDGSRLSIQLGEAGTLSLRKR